MSDQAQIEVTIRFRDVEKTIRGNPQEVFRSVFQFLSETIPALDIVSKDLGATLAQVSLAWLVAHGVTAPIASATSLDQLQELIGATKLKLSPDAVRLLDDASKADPTAAEREVRTPPPSAR